MLCQLCREDKKLIDAHIVARCLLDKLFHPDGPPQLISKEKGTLAKRLPMGEYDNKILCSECDSSFSSWEDYTADLLYRKNNVYEAAADAGRNGQSFITIPNYNYTSLKLCLLSILWRMSVSKKHDHAIVALGPYENKIRKMLLTSDPGGADDFTVILLRIYGEYASSTMVGTVKKKMFGANSYMLGLPGYCAVIKVDNLPFKEIPLGAAITSGKPLIIATQHMDLKPHAIQMALNHRETKQALKNKRKNLSG